MMAANPSRKRSNTMSKKISTKTTKTAKATKKAKAAKPATKLATGECPKGGAHEWAYEGDEVFCSKCKARPGREATSTRHNPRFPSQSPAQHRRLLCFDLSTANCFCCQAAEHSN